MIHLVEGPRRSCKSTFLHETVTSLNRAGVSRYDILIKAPNLNTANRFPVASGTIHRGNARGVMRWYFEYIFLDDADYINIIWLQQLFLHRDQWNHVWISVSDGPNKNFIMNNMNDEDVRHLYQHEEV